MTYKEIIEKYKNLFLLLTEKAGSETGIKEYKEIDTILKKPENLEMVEELIKAEPDFKIVVSRAQMYKQAGNSVTEPLIEKVAAELIRIMKEYQK